MPRKNKNAQGDGQQKKATKEQKEVRNIKAQGGVRQEGNKKK